jgi:CelD/BcsL family acetyltransferase involved in cellulose biosynthesis
VSAIRVELLAPSARAHVAARWTALQTRAGAVRLPCRWAWTAAWLEHFGPAVDHRFALGTEHGKLIGAALITRDVVYAGPLPVRRLHVGTAGEPPGESVYVERNGLLVAPGRGPAFAAALVRRLGEEGGWDALCLDGFVPEEAAAFADTGLALTLDVQPCWVTDLPDAQDVVELLTANTRRQIRRNERRVGDTRVRWARGRADALAMLDALMGTHERRWNMVGEPGVFAAPRFAGFHRTLVSRLAPSGEVWLAEVSAGGGLLSSFYGFMEGERMASYQSGRALMPDHRVASGMLGEVALMRAARARGVSIYDPLAGDSYAKRRLSTRREELVWGVGRRGRARWAVHDVARGARRRVLDARTL